MLPRWALCAPLVALSLLGSEAEGRERARPPASWAALRATLPEEGPQRAEALARFVRDRTPALRDRSLALSAWRRALPAGDPGLVDAALTEAHLAAVGRQSARRARALARAAGLLPGDDERRPHVEAAAAAEPKLAALIERTAARRRAKVRAPVDADEAALLSDLERTLPHYEALDDGRRAADVQLALALFLEVSAADRHHVDRELQNLVRVGGRDRDVAPVRQAVRRARARVLWSLGRIEEALHESLVADRAGWPPPAVAAAPEPKPPAYRRSRETADLCWAARARGVSCADLERDHMGALTFYDFSQEALPAFDPERARAARASFEPLLSRCADEGTLPGLTLTGPLELEWAIGTDGEAHSLTLLPRRARSTRLGRCLVEALARFRYPRYPGEEKHHRTSLFVGATGR